MKSTNHYYYYYQRMSNFDFPVTTTKGSSENTTDTPALRGTYHQQFKLCYFSKNLVQSVPLKES